MHGGNYTEKITQTRKELHGETYTEEHTDVHTWRDRQGSDIYEGTHTEGQRGERETERGERDREGGTKREKQRGIKRKGGTYRE